MKNVICILLLFCCCTICNAQSCYQETRAKGISLYNQKKYKEAINVFEAAKDCPDKPAAHDLNAMIKNCRDAISAQEERSIQEQEEAKRRRAAAQRAATSTPSPINIQKTEFCNALDGKIIDDWGATLYASKMKYIHARITYSNPSNTPYSADLYVKLYKPDGTLMSGTSSPEGYTYLETIFVKGGNNNSIELGSWGNKERNAFSTGKYLFEVWQKGKKLYATAITLFEQSNETTRLASNSKENALSRGEWRTLMNKAFDHVTSSYDNQDSYKGEKSDNGKSGLGVYRWSAGSYHWGKLSMDNFNGVGIYITSQGFTLNNCPNCYYYVGNYSNDKLEGKGTCYDQYGNLIYYGEFSNDAPTETYPSTANYSSYKFECFIYTRKPYAHGGNMYIGETKNGKRHGKGILLWREGDAWYGEWTDDKRDGYGIHMYYDGSITVGRWNDDTYTAN